MSEIAEDFSGFWEIKNKPISKVGVFPYLGAGLSGAPDPMQTYMVFRPAEELGNPETVNSFKLMPWVIAHDMLGPEDRGLTPPEAKGVHGVIGEDVYFNPEEGVLYANIKCFSETMKQDIENGIKGLSAGYFHQTEWTGGTWNGQRYDAVQRHIRANHLALVHAGRMGPDVALDAENDFDPNIFTDTENSMTMEELIAAVKALTEEVAAIKAAGGNSTADANPAAAGETTTDDAAGQPGAGADQEPGEEAPIALAEAVTELAEEVSALKNNGTAADAAPGAAADADPDKDKGSSMDAAMIQKSILADMQVRDRLVKKLTPILGSFDHDLMTSMDVAEYACKKLNVEHGNGLAGLAIAAYLQGTVAAGGSDRKFSMDAAAHETGRSAKMTDYLGGK